MILGNIKEIASRNKYMRRFELNGEKISVDNRLIEKVTLVYAIECMTTNESRNFGNTPRKAKLERFIDELNIALTETMARLAQ